MHRLRHDAPLTPQEGKVVTVQELLDAIGLPAMCESAADMLEYLVPQVIAANNPGRITIQLTVRPLSNSGVEVLGRVSQAVPKQQTDTRDGWMAALYWGEGGTLLADDPKQPRLLGA